MIKPLHTRRPSERYRLRALLFLLVGCLLLAASPRAEAQIQGPNVPPGFRNKHPLAGSDRALPMDEAARQQVQREPDRLRSAPSAIQFDWGFIPGQSHVWTAVDFTNGAPYAVSSTCRAVGMNCYVFVEDSLWNVRVSQSVVDTIIAGFEVRTPARSDAGMWSVITDVFGPPPDVDNDPRIIVLIMNIRDGWNGAGGYVAGYFSSANETGSNLAEMLYLDADPADLLDADDCRDVLGTAAHEFQHMIHFRNDPSEITFINEMCSLTATLSCGYGLYSQNYFVDDPSRGLFDWRGSDPISVLSDYSRAARFGLYLVEQFGMGVVGEVARSALHGTDGLADGLSRSGILLSVRSLLINWFVANVLDDRSIDPVYGYQMPGLPRVTGSVFYRPEYSSVLGTSMRRLSGTPLTFRNVGRMSATINVSGADYVVKAIERGAGVARVVDVVPNVTFIDSAVGDMYDEVTFLMINPSNDFSAWMATVTGTPARSTIELKWDDAEPVRPLALSTGDSVCVEFNAIPGARLDSVRVALRRPGALVGGIWRSSGVIRPSPLATPLVAPVGVSIITAADSVLPLPASNWACLDLRPWQIDLGSSIAVAFAVGEDPSTPGIMATMRAGQSSYHSYTYIDDPLYHDWYYYTAGSDSVWLYVIRAYASFPDVNHVVELEPMTQLANLEQSFPNPFNSLTNVDFRLEIGEFVKVSVVDLLGREVAVLVDERLAPGRYTVRWNAEGFSSGVYYCRLQTRTFTQTQKMLLLR